MPQTPVDSQKKDLIPLTVSATVLLGIASALATGLSFEVIKYWPLPASVEPYMSLTGGLWWGGIGGAITGLILGHVLDEKHFSS